MFWELIGIGVAEAATEEALSIHLAPAVLFHVLGFPITNTLLNAWLAMAVLLVIAVVVRVQLKKIPGKFQIIFESLIGYVLSYMKEVLGDDRRAKQFFPLIMTIFLFILAINWVSLLPGLEGILYTAAEGHGSTQLFHAATADLNVTIALALIAFVAIEFAGIAALGIFKYGGKFINFSSPLNFLIGVIELMSELARLISFSFRLFGNIFAGKTLLLVVAFFVPFVLPVPLMAFEVFVGFIQAFVFAILTLFFIRVATEKPH